MKILYVTDSLKIGGAETLLLDMARDFTARGHQVEIAYFTDGPLRGEFAALGITPHRLSRHGLKNPGALLRMALLIRRFKPNVIHTHLRKSDLAGQLTARLMQVPVRVSTAHNIDPWRSNRALSAIAAACTAGCHKIIAVSSEVCDYTVNVAGESADKVVTICNGIDLQRFDPATVQPASGDPWDSAGPLIGIIGRLDPQKDHATFLAAAALISAQEPRARFVIVGDGIERNRLARLAAKLNLGEKAVFAGLQRDMPAVLAALDIIVFSSRWEGLPVALLEALAMCRPVVGTAVGGIPGVIEHGTTGLLVPPAEPAALAERIRQLLGDDALAARLGAAGRRLVAQQYSQRRMHDQVLALYETLARREPPE
ncbi:MAG: glycosyltransferase [Gammaproteobacteria bacterium]|nr:glycosyltransferase [Gammaproteobacteria bacterium]